MTRAWGTPLQNRNINAYSRLRTVTEWLQYWPEGTNSCLSYPRKSWKLILRPGLPQWAEESYTVESQIQGGSFISRHQASCSSRTLDTSHAMKVSMFGKVKTNSLVNSYTSWPDPQQVAADRKRDWRECWTEQTVIGKEKKKKEKKKTLATLTPAAQWLQDVTHPTRIHTTRRWSETPACHREYVALIFRDWKR